MMSQIMTIGASLITSPMIDIIIIKCLKWYKIAKYDSKTQVSKCYWNNGKTQDTGLPQTFNLKKKEKENAISVTQYSEMQ